MIFLSEKVFIISPTMKKFKVQIMENIEYPTHNKGNKNRTTLIFSRKIKDGACGY